jgi:hypothetical protein
MRLIVATLVAAATIAVSGAAFASDADFKLTNKTGYQIDNVYVGASSSKSWGKDLMGKDSLDDGESVKITFPHGNNTCRFDIMVKYNDGDTAEFNRVDLCKFEVIKLYWNGKQTSFVGE